MIDFTVFNKPNSSDEDITRCASQIDVSDCVLCKMCPNYSTCVGLAMKKLSQKLKES